MDATVIRPLQIAYPYFYASLIHISMHQSLRCSAKDIAKYTRKRFVITFSLKQ